jgi:protein arginine kinase
MTENRSSFVGLPVFDHSWENNANSIWLASTLSIHRNIDKFNFPQRLDNEKRRLVAELVEGTIKQIPFLSGISILPLDALHPIDREFLAEHFLMFEPVHDNQYGQAFITEKSGTILIQLNANDHLELRAIESSGELEKALDTLMAIEQSIENHLPFSFSNTFGYLTSDPCQSGTGMIVNAYVHIPALIAKGGYHKAISNEHQEGLLFTSLQGNPEDLIGDLLVVKNRWTTGVAEEAILSSIRNTVQRIVEEEQSLRTKIKEEKDTQVIDRISRAIGTLQHSFTIDTSESLRAISQVKFGIELGLVRGIAVEAINELFFDCRRAHLAKKMNMDLYVSPQLYSARAQFFREIMASVTLT